MEHVGYYNGTIAPADELMIPALDRAVYFGDGCYEATTFTNRHMFAREDHFDRFYNSARLLEMPLPWSREELAAELQKVIDACDGSQGMLYWQASRGTAPRLHQYSVLELTPNLLAFAVPMEKITIGDKEARLISLEDKRFYYCNIKTLNLIPNVMCHDLVDRSGYDENVFYREGFGQKRVTEGAHSNILMIKDGVLTAPPADNLILPGVTLKHLFKLAPELGIRTARTPFTLEELAAADEIIVSSSGDLMWRGVELDGKPAGCKDPDTFFRLADAYRAYYEEETK